MKNKRRNHTAQFKAKVAFEAAKGDKTIAELAGEYEVHPTPYYKNIHPIHRAALLYDFKSPPKRSPT